MGRSMARLTISEASRVAGVARSTLHRAIKQGRLSLDPDGHLDTAELLRCGYTLQGGAQQERNTTLQPATVERPVAQQVPIPASDLVLAALERERALLQHQLDATRDLLQGERQAALDRERAAREREALLLQMLHEAQQRYDRLLEAPRPPPAPVSRVQASPSAPLRASGMLPPVWALILDYVREGGTP